MRRFNIKMSILFKLIYKFNSGSIKIATGFLMDLNKLILKFMLKSKAPRIDKTILKKSNGGQIIKTYQGIAIKTVWQLADG